MPEFTVPVTEEQMEQAGSKFAEVGQHISRVGIPVWDTPGVSIAFPIVIENEADPDNGKENKISAGVKEDAVWKLKECLNAMKVAWEKDPETGFIKFNGDECIGKKVIVEWEQQQDSRSAAEGGRGNKYTKPIRMLPYEPEQTS